MAIKLIDNLHPAIRLPLRGLMGVTGFILMCALIVGIIYVIGLIGHFIFAVTGAKALIIMGAVILGLCLLAWLGATMEDF